MLYFTLGVLAPIMLNLMHLIVGLYGVTQRGNLISLGFTGIGMLTKSIAMLFLTWLGVGYLDLDFRIYIPLLTFFWFFTHVVEAFVIQHYMNQNGSEYIKSVIHNFNKTVVVRPSVVCGPEDNFTNLFSKLSFLPIIPIVGMKYNFQPILVLRLKKVHHAYHLFLV